MANTVILHSTPIEELRDIIGDVVREQLKDFQLNRPPQPTTEYITRKQVCSVLNISLATLYFYTRDGILKGYRIGGRVLYKRSEVEQSVTEIASLKYKKREV